MYEARQGSWAGKLPGTTNPAFSSGLPRAKFHITIKNHSACAFFERSSHGKKWNRNLDSPLSPPRSMTNPITFLFLPDPSQCAWALPPRAALSPARGRPPPPPRMPGHNQLPLPSARTGATPRPHGGKPFPVKMIHIQSQRRGWLLRINESDKLKLFEEPRLFLKENKIQKN